MNIIGIRMFLKRLKMIPYFLRDKTVPWYKKVFMVLCIAYILIPIDLVPIFPLDDLFLFIFMIWHFRDELDSYWNGEKAEDLSKNFRDKDMVEGVEFTVEEEDSKD